MADNFSFNLAVTYPGIVQRRVIGHHLYQVLKFTLLELRVDYKEESCSTTAFLKTTVPLTADDDCFLITDWSGNDRITCFVPTNKEQSWSVKPLSAYQRELQTWLMQHETIIFPIFTTPLLNIHSSIRLPSLEEIRIWIEERRPCSSFLLLNDGIPSFDELALRWKTHQLQERDTDIIMIINIPPQQLQDPHAWFSASASLQLLRQDKIADSKPFLIIILSWTPLEFSQLDKKGITFISISLADELFPEMAEKVQATAAPSQIPTLGWRRRPSYRRRLP